MSDPLEILNATGFPFQLSIERLVRKLESETRDYPWHFWAREFAWSHPHAGEDGFIDLVLVNAGGPEARLRFASRGVIALEAKRFSSDKPLVFLEPTFPSRRDTGLPVLWAARHNNASLVAYFTTHLRADIAFASFAALPDRSGNVSLEKLGTTLLLSSEALAHSFLQDGLFVEPEHPVAFLPLLVTNSKLLVATASEEDLSDPNGKLTSAQTREVPLVAFVKSMLTPAPEVSDFAPDFWGLPSSRDRALFVASASGLEEVLPTLTPIPNSSIRHELQRILTESRGR